MAGKTENKAVNWPDKASAQLTQTLDAFLAAANVPQAYLFMGSSDQESDARKLVEAFAGNITNNKFPNVDTLIFDAADGSGIEGIREILNLSSLMPVASEKKVLVMLNMHQASPQMMNALLKTLEEPSEHASYLLLSARPVLPTIMSRCQVFSLHHSETDLTEQSDELTEALQLLISNRKTGQAERMVLVNELAALEDELLPQVLETWLKLQVAELKTAPQNFPAVRATTEAIQSLRGNFNKKMVLQQFVTTGLV